MGLNRAILQIIFQGFIGATLFFLVGTRYLKFEYVWKHKNCLDPQIKDYSSIDFTLT